MDGSKRTLGRSTRRAFIVGIVATMAGASAAQVPRVGRALGFRSGFLFQAPLTTASLAAYAPDSNAVAVANASAAAGSPMSDNQINRLSRFMVRAKAAGLSQLKSVGVRGLDETQFRMNLADPSRPLTKVGSPTYTLAAGGGGFSTTSYYDTTVALSEIGQNNVSMGHLSRTSGSLATTDMGVIDSTASLAIFPKATANDKSAYRVFTGANVVPAAGTAYWTGEGWNSFTRSAANAFRAGHHGVDIETVTSTSATPTDTTKTVSIGWTKGAGSASTRSCAGWYVGAALSAAQERELTAALNDYDLCVRWGFPFIYDRGVGPASVSVEHVVYGLSLSAIVTAYDLARSGKTVALVGGWADDSLWDLGGMVTSGLDAIDAKVPGHVKGIVRDMLTVGNASVLGRADDSTQDGLSFEARIWSAVIRRMLDPSRTSAATGISLLPGQDIKVYMTGGVTEVAKDASGRITSIKTADGRVFNGQVFYDQGYDGDLIRLHGAVPVQTGRGVATARESLDGYQGNGLLKPQNTSGGTQLDVDPFVTAGNSSSGLIYGVLPDPGLAQGAEDVNGLQPLVKRATWATTLGRAAPFSTTANPPAGYVASNYEMFGRIFSSASAAGLTIALASLVEINPISSTSADTNNGKVRIGVDAPNSGLQYHAAGGNYALRRQLFTDVQAWYQGFMHWLVYSGDSRIFAGLKTSLANYGVDALNHLDPGGSGVPVGWPKNAYTREPFVLLKNASLIYDSTDFGRADGTTPRSTKTVTTISYARDLHSIRFIAKDNLLQIQGSFYDATTTAGGSDFIAPVPLEVMMPDKAVCPNLLTSTCPSLTRGVYGSYRMEPTMAMGGQSLAQIGIYAVANSTAVQDVDYTTVRAALTGANDNTKLTLPRTN